MTTTDLATSRQGYDEAVRTARDYLCADCGNVLLVRWNGSRYQANCGRWPDEHEHIRSHAEVQADDTRERLERSPQLNQSMVLSRDVPLTTQAIKALSDVQLQSRIDVAFADIVDATPALRGQIKGLSKLYGLDPIFDLMIYQHRPYVTYAGRLRKLREAAEYRGHKVRPLNREEKELWGFKPEDIVVECNADMGPHGIITDYGIVRAQGESSPVAKQHPQPLAIKRAVARCSNQAVGIDIPTVIETTGRVLDVQEISPTRAALSPGDAEANARRRFWATARGAPPDGLGLDDAAVHDLLGVDTLKDYPGGWDQALSDLTERAAADEETAPGEVVVDMPAEPAKPESEPSMVKSVRNPLYQRHAVLFQEAAEMGVDVEPFNITLPAPQLEVEQKLQGLGAAISALRRAAATTDAPSDQTLPF